MSGLNEASLVPSPTAQLHCSSAAVECSHHTGFGESAIDSVDSIGVFSDWLLNELFSVVRRFVELVIELVTTQDEETHAEPLASTKISKTQPIFVNVSVCSINAIEAFWDRCGIPMVQMMLVRLNIRGG